MREALAKVRKVMSRQDIVPKFAQYLIRDKMISAYDGRYAAAAPVDYEGPPFYVPGREFERLLDRLPGDPTIEHQGERIIVRSGRIQGRIKALDARTAEIVPPDEDWDNPPAGFLDSLRLTRPFVSDNATHDWALCVLLEFGLMRATTNVSMAEVVCDGLDAGGHLLPCWAVDYVLFRSEALTGLQIRHSHCAFQWEDGSWMRTQLVQGEFPPVASKLFENFQAPSWEITPEWREAYQTVVELTEVEVEIYADRLVGRQGEGETEYSVPSVTPVPENGVVKFDPRFLSSVVANATHWSPDRYPNPTAFTGRGLRGLIVGRR